MDVTAVRDDQLAQLLREVHEISFRPEVKAALGKLDDRAVKRL